MEYLIILLLIILFAFGLSHVIGEYIKQADAKWWNTVGKNNFPFKWRGKTLWYSRSVAVVLFTFCKNKLGEWCVLANQRGEGAPDYQGYWNSSCGYLDFNETSFQASQRECKEETGIVVPLDKIKFFRIIFLIAFKIKFNSLNSSPDSNRQNVTIRHTAILDGTIDDWSNFSKDNMEYQVIYKWWMKLLFFIPFKKEIKPEVADIKWIPLSKLEEYEWAFGHKELIETISKEVIA